MSTLALACCLALAFGQAPPTLEEARALLQRGELDEAVGMLEEITRAEPANGPAWRILGDALRSQHEPERALQAYQEAMKVPASAPVASYNAACLCALRGDKERAFALLLRAEASGGFDLVPCASDPDLASLRDDARFAALWPAPEVYAEPFVEPVRVLREWRGEAALSQFGWIARNLGDVDGDGACDVVTSAPSYGPRGNPQGRVYAYSSRSGALLWSATGEPGDQLGLGVEAAGDVDADGVGDVIAGAPGRGLARVHSGRDGRVLLELSGDAAGQFGRKVCGVGDVDGDGHADVLVGAPLQGRAAAGRASVHAGSDGHVLFTLDGARDGDNLGSAAAGWSGAQGSWIAVGAPKAGADQRGRVRVVDGHGAARFEIAPLESGAALGGMFLSILGDVDGDGVPDVYASDWSDAALGSTTGRIYVHSGRSGARLWQRAGVAAGDGFGIGPANAGDVDGDGLADLVVGSWQHASAAPSGGRVDVLCGRDGRVLRTITCKVRGDTFGFDATGLGDVDGDGKVDFLVTSAWSAVNGTRSGRVFVLAGE